MPSSGSLPLATYHRTSALGAGTYGSVVTVYNDDGEAFALKLFIPDDEGENNNNNAGGEYGDDDSNSDDDYVPCSDRPIDLGALREISCLRLFRKDNGHPNIVEMVDVQSQWIDGNEDEAGAGTAGYLGMALPLFPHGSLAQALDRGIFRTTGRGGGGGSALQGRVVKVQMAHQLLSAVAFLHDQGMVHRDIKCDNILLDLSEDDTWKPILIDFSLAKPIDATIYYGQSLKDSPALLHDAVPHTGEVATVGYTAPEVIDQEPYGQGVDIYSLGVVFLELLRDELFTALKHKESLQQIQQALDRLPFDQPFPNLIRGMLQHDPDDRLTALQALQHPIFAKFGLTLPPPTRIIHMASALPYEYSPDSGQDNVGNEENVENAQPNGHSAKADSRTSIKKRKSHRSNSKQNRRIQKVEKLCQYLGSQQAVTRQAALEYSIQLEQVEGEDLFLEDNESQSLHDCVVLAHRFFEVEYLDLDELDQADQGPFANWSLEQYVDNESTLFMLLDFCLYPRHLAVN